MIPILYGANETAFTTNGIGRLTDAIECTVTEERNGEYELFLRYPLSGQYFSEIQKSRILFAVPADGRAAQPFRIYRLEKPLDGICAIYAEHISYQLSFIPVMPFTASGVALALQGLVTNAAEACPFTVWTNKSTTGNFTVREPQSFRALLGGTEGSILDVFGTGEYEFDRYQVKLYTARGSDNGVTIRYGKNLVDLTQDENIENTITGVLPYWRDSETGAIVTLPEKVLWSANANNYPYKRTRPLDLTDNWGEAPTAAQLRAAAQAYMVNNNIGVPKVNLEVEFVALWQMSGAGMENYQSLERVNLCDTVTVIFERLGVSAKAKVIRTVYNVLQDRYDKIEIGDARTSLETAINEAAEDAVERAGGDQMSILQKYVDHQTALITGGLGGYVVINQNANGEPNEILVLDQPDIETAVNVLRINQNGIGFSHNGYSGPYFSAWTIDGVFNASAIGAGLMDGVYIRAGTITTAQLAAGAITVGKLDSEVAGSITTAQTTADNAASAASAAASAASAANTLAAGKSTVYYSTADPSGSGFKAGDVWIKNVSGGISGDVMWTYSGSAWIQHEIGTTTIINGSITTDLLAANAVTAAKIAAGSITAEKIATGAITAGNISLYGKMGVFTDSTLATNGGYLGYMSGSIADGSTTTGIALMDSASKNFVIATTAGVRMTNGSATTKGELYITNGVTAILGVRTQIQGGVYLNTTNRTAYAGDTYCGPSLYVYGASSNAGLVRLSAASDAYGEVITYNSSGYILVYIGRQNYNGFVGCNAADGNRRAQMGVNASNQGNIWVRDAYNRTTATLTATTNGGALYIFDASTTPVNRATLYATTAGGFLQLLDGSGNSAILSYADIVKLHNL